MSFNPLGDRYQLVRAQVNELALACGRQPEEVILIAVSKTHPCSAIQQVYQAGCTDFGESRVQEALQKIEELPAGIEWHLIGTLQKNKVNKAVGAFSLIHSVDSPELARKIAEVSEKRGIRTRILLQVNTSLESSKHGLTAEEWRKCICEVDQLSGLQLEGLMTMAPHVEDHEVIRKCFASLRNLKEEFQQQVKDPSFFRQLSMGMSHDYSIAIQEGATMIRIGSAIFSH